MTAGTYLGFDFGLRRIGVAAGQAVTGTAGAVTTLDARDGVPDWERVEVLLAEWRPAGVVVGVPYNMDGSASELSERAERFARRLEGRFGLPVHRVDERLSSKAAERFLREARQAGRRRTRKGDVDAEAARFILETWLGGGTDPGTEDMP